MVTLSSHNLQVDLAKAEKIGQGRYREVFRMGDLALKVLKSHVRKNYGLFHIDYPMKVYTKYKFGIADFNQFEFEMYQGFIDRIPLNLRNRFYRIHSVDNVGGRSYLLADLVLDDDGSLSKPLSKQGKSDNHFWERVKELEEVLIDKEVPVLDIRGENILVQNTAQGVIPVMVDYKRFGRKTYPFQFGLSSKKSMIKKQRRRFQRLREQYQLS